MSRDSYGVIVQGSDYSIAQSINTKSIASHRLEMRYGKEHG